MRKEDYGRKTVLFNTRYPWETMFYTEITAYKETPDLQTVKRLHSEGFVLLINNKEELSPEYRQLDFVTYLNLAK